MKSAVNEEHIMGNAEIRGIHCTVDVIEISRQFFDGTRKIDKDKDKLPFYDELLELDII